MSDCCKCYETRLRFVKYPYDPKNTFIYFDVPTLWLNEVTHQLFILAGIVDGVAQWDILNISSSIISSILLDDGSQIAPIDLQIKFHNGEGIIITGSGNEITFSLDIPITSSQGGTGQTNYTFGDLLVANATGQLEKLSKGNIGQVLGVKPDGSLGYITSSGTAPIQRFSVFPCGELIPNVLGEVALRFSENFSCYFNDDKSEAIINVTLNDDAIKDIFIPGCGTVRPDVLGHIGLDLSDNFICEVINKNTVLKLDIKPFPSNAIDKIVTPCGTLTPVNNTVKLTMGQGLDTTCTEDELTTKLKVPVASNLGGTGIQQYNKGDILIGKEDGTLEKLTKGEPGQFLGIDNNGNLTYLNPSIVPSSDKIVDALAEYPDTNVNFPIGDYLNKE